MTENQTIDIAKKYAGLLSTCEPLRVDTSKKACELSDKQLLGHVVWMCHQIFNRRVIGDKAQRWLCWIQGVLFMKNIYTIDEERNHNREELEIP